MGRVHFPPDDLIAEADEKLGRANGNIYHRLAGVDGVHDGQIMVRLKKKRFVVLDYSIQPTEEDIQVAASTPHIHIPTGAGKAPCSNADCNKVGVPVCLYDSDPTEPDPLYIRSGLCFVCQRNLNEKRRTERKRPGRDSFGANLIFALGPSSKKLKLNGDTIHLQSDALIINGATEGVRHYGEGYSFQEMGSDLTNLVNEAASDTERLVHAVSGGNVAAAVAAVGDVPLSAEAAASAVVEISGLLPMDATTEARPSNDDINSLYDKALKSMSKAIYLLSQWKSSWDAALAAAQETVADQSLADAVASAAAVVAAATTGDVHDQSSSMVSLLLAADKRHDDDDDDGLGNNSDTVGMQEASV